MAPQTRGKMKLSMICPCNSISALAIGCLLLREDADVAAEGAGLYGEGTEWGQGDTALRGSVTRAKGRLVGTPALLCSALGHGPLLQAVGRRIAEQHAAAIRRPEQPQIRIRVGSQRLAITRRPAARIGRAEAQRRLAHHRARIRRAQLQSGAATARAVDPPHQ